MNVLFFFFRTKSPHNNSTKHFIIVMLGYIIYYCHLLCISCQPVIVILISQTGSVSNKNVMFSSYIRRSKERSGCWIFFFFLWLHFVFGLWVRAYIGSAIVWPHFFLRLAWPILNVEKKITKINSDENNTQTHHKNNQQKSIFGNCIKGLRLQQKKVRVLLLVRGFLFATDTNGYMYSLFG